jgi:hypothetical protein
MKRATFKNSFPKRGKKKAAPVVAPKPTPKSLRVDIPQKGAHRVHVVNHMRKDIIVHKEGCKDIEKDMRLSNTHWLQDVPAGRDVASVVVDELNESFGWKSGDTEPQPWHKHNITLMPCVGRANVPLPELNYSNGRLQMKKKTKKKFKLGGKKTGGDKTAKQTKRAEAKAKRMEARKKKLIARTQSRGAKLLARLEKAGVDTAVLKSAFENLSK